MLRLLREITYKKWIDKYLVHCKCSRYVPISSHFVSTVTKSTYLVQGFLLNTRCNFYSILLDISLVKIFSGILSLLNLIIKFIKYCSLTMMYNRSPLEITTRLLSLRVWNQHSFFNIWRGNYKRWGWAIVPWCCWVGKAKRIISTSCVFSGTISKK